MNIEADFIPTKDNGGLDMDIDLSRPEAALLQERAIIGRLSREELEDRSVDSLRGCPSTGESNHWQALQGRAGGQVSMQPQRLPYFMREQSLAGSPGISWRTGQYSLRGCHTVLQERPRKELEDR